MRPTVLVSEPNVPAPPRVGLSRLQLVRFGEAFVGSACGSVPTGFAKFAVLNRLKTSTRSSTFERPRKGDVLRGDEVDLVEARPVKRVALEVAERARLPASRTPPGSGTAGRRP